MEIHDEVEIEDDQAEVFGPQIELDLGTGSNPVHDLEDEMFLIIEERPGDSFKKVGYIDLIEEEQRFTELVSSTPSAGNLTGEEPRKKPN